MGLIRMILEKAMWKSEGAGKGMLDVDMLSEQLGLITLFWEKDGEDDTMRMVVGVEKNAEVDQGHYEMDVNDDGILGDGSGGRMQNDVQLLEEVFLEMDEGKDDSEVGGNKLGRAEGKSWVGVADLSSSNTDELNNEDVQVHEADAEVNIDEENAEHVAELHHHGGGGGADQNRRIPGTIFHKSATIFHDKDYFKTVHWANMCIDRPDGGPEGQADQDPGRVGQARGEGQGAKNGVLWIRSKTYDDELCEAAAGGADVVGAPPGKLQDDEAIAQGKQTSIKYLTIFDTGSGEEHFTNAGAEGRRRAATHGGDGHQSVDGDGGTDTHPHAHPQQLDDGPGYTSGEHDGGARGEEVVQHTDGGVATQLHRNARSRKWKKGVRRKSVEDINPGLVQLKISGFVKLFPNLCSMGKSTPSQMGLKRKSSNQPDCSGSPAKRIKDHFSTGTRLPHF